MLTQSSMCWQMPVHVSKCDYTGSSKYWWSEIPIYWLLHYLKSTLPRPRKLNYTGMWKCCVRLCKILAVPKFKALREPRPHQYFELPCTAWGCSLKKLLALRALPYSCSLLCLTNCGRCWFVFVIIFLTNSEPKRSFLITRFLANFSYNPGP